MIHRYRMFKDSLSDCYCEMEEWTDGDYVLYAAIAEKNDRLLYLEEWKKEAEGRLIACGEALSWKDKEIAEIKTEVKRLADRDGKATFQLFRPTTEDPWNKIALRIVDFGVADNTYIVEEDHD